MYVCSVLDKVFVQKSVQVFSANRTLVVIIFGQKYTWLTICVLVLTMFLIGIMVHGTYGRNLVIAPHKSAKLCSMGLPEVIGIRHLSDNIKNCILVDECVKILHLWQSAPDRGSLRRSPRVTHYCLVKVTHH